MKKFFSLLLALILCASICSCESDATGSNGSITDKNETTSQKSDAATTTPDGGADTSTTSQKEDPSHDIFGEKEIAALLVSDEWRSFDYSAKDLGYEALRFYEDGTCVLGDETLTWQIQKIFSYLDKVDILINDGTETVYMMQVGMDEVYSVLCILNFHSIDFKTYCEYYYLPQDYKTVFHRELNRYWEEYQEKGSFQIARRSMIMGYSTLYDNEAGKYLYENLMAYGDYGNSKEILSHFIVLPDMLVDISLQQTDHLGNSDQSVYATYQYNEKGECLTSDQAKFFEFLGLNTQVGKNHSCEWEHDEMGRVRSMTVKKFTAIAAVITPEYDTNGNIIKAIIKTNDGEYVNTYQYNAFNRLISAERSVGADRINTTSLYQPGNFSLKKDYHDSGKLEKETLTWLRGGKECYEITQYAYDGNGNLIRKEYTYFNPYSREEEIVLTEYFYVNGWLTRSHEEKNEYAYIGSEKTLRTTVITEMTYNNDENGHPISAEITETVNGKSNYASQILTYHYEDLYFCKSE